MAGQCLMQRRIADVLRGEHPRLAELVEKLPLHGDDEEARIDEAWQSARVATKPLVDAELAAERVTAEILNFRLD